MKKQIEEMAIVLSEGVCTECNCDANGRFNCMRLYDAELLYNAGYRKQEWTCVKDSPPKRNGRYLTHCCVDGQSLVCILYYNKYSGFDEDTVTHWMPLPEPPKMKGGVE